MVEVTAAEIAEAANEAIAEGIKQSAEAMAAQPTAWEKAREFIRVSACDHLYGSELLDFEEWEMIDKAAEDVKAQEAGKRMERAYKELGIESAEELENRQFLTAADVEKTSAYQYMQEQFRKRNAEHRANIGIRMEDFVQKAAKGEL